MLYIVYSVEMAFKVCLHLKAFADHTELAQKLLV